MEPGVDPGVVSPRAASVAGSAPTGRPFRRGPGHGDCFFAAIMKPVLGALLALALATQSACATQGGGRRSLTERDKTSLAMVFGGLAVAVYGLAEMLRAEEAGLLLLIGGVASVIGGSIRMSQDKLARGAGSGQQAAAPWPIRMRGPAMPSRRVASGGSR